MVVLAVLKLLQKCYRLSKNLPISPWENICKPKTVEFILKQISSLPLGMICTSEMAKKADNTCKIVIKKKDLEDLLDIMVDPKNLMKKIVEIGILPTNIMLSPEKLCLLFLDIIIEKCPEEKKEEIKSIKQELETILKTKVHIEDYIKEKVQEELKNQEVKKEDIEKIRNDIINSADAKEELYKKFQEKQEKIKNLIENKIREVIIEFINSQNFLNEENIKKIIGDANSDSKQEEGDDDDDDEEEEEDDEEENEKEDNGQNGGAHYSTQEIIMNFINELQILDSSNIDEVYKNQVEEYKNIIENKIIEKLTEFFLERRKAFTRIFKLSPELDQQLLDIVKKFSENLRKKETSVDILSIQTIKEYIQDQNIVIDDKYKKTLNSLYLLLKDEEEKNKEFIINIFTLINLFSDLMKSSEQERESKLKNVQKAISETVNNEIQKQAEKNEFNNFTIIDAEGSEAYVRKVRENLRILEVLFRVYILKNRNETAKKESNMTDDINNIIVDLKKNFEFKGLLEKLNVKNFNTLFGSNKGGFNKTKKIIKTRKNKTPRKKKYKKYKSSKRYKSSKKYKSSKRYKTFKRKIKKIYSNYKK